MSRTTNPSSEADVWDPDKPSQNENEYFARRDAQWLKDRRAALDAERATPTAAVTSLICPRCQGALVERSVEHVRLDVCNSCRGVWLDTGELEMVAHLPAEALVRFERDIKAK